MTLAGGNPDVMDFPRFLDVSYALLAEEHQRINPLKDLLSIRNEVAPPLATSPRPKVKTTVAKMNEDSMATLQGMLAGVSNAPGKRKPRRGAR